MLYICSINQLYVLQTLPFCKKKCLVHTAINIFIHTYYEVGQILGSGYAEHNVWYYDMGGGVSPRLMTCLRLVHDMFMTCSCPCFKTYNTFEGVTLTNQYNRFYQGF